MSDTPDFIAPQQLDEAIGLGMKPVAGEVNVVTNNGSVVSIPAADYEALRGDFAGVASSDQVAAYQAQQAAAARQEELEQQGGRAFLEAAAATAWDSTLGAVGPVKGRELLSRIAGSGAQATGEGAMYGADDPRAFYATAAAQRQKEAAYEAESRAVAQANQSAYGWGKFAGTVAGGLAGTALTGGTFGLQHAGTLGRITAAGIEGGIGGLTSAREDAFIKNEQLTASAAFDAVAHGSMFGVLIGGAMAGAGPAYRALRGAKRLDAAAEGVELGAKGLAREAGEDAARAVQTSEGNVLRETLEEQAGKLAKKMYSRAPEEPMEMMMGAGGKEARKLLREGIDKNALSREMAGAVDDLVNRGNVQDMTRLLKPDAVRKLTNPALVQQQRAAVANMVADQGTAIQGILHDSADSAIPKGTIKLLRNIDDAIHLSKVGAKDLDGAELFLAQDEIKRMTQKATLQLRGRERALRADGLIADADELSRVAGILDNSQQRGIKNLTDATIWGKDLAGYQSAVNQAWEEFIPNAERFERSFLRQGETIFETSGKELRSDSQKIYSHLNGLGTAASDDAVASVDQMVLAQKKFVDALERYGLGDADKLKAARSAIDSVERVQATVNKHADVRRAMGELAEFGAEDPLGKAAGVVPGVGKALKFALNPADGIRTLAMLESMTRNSESGIANAARSALGLGKAISSGVSSPMALAMLAGRGAARKAGETVARVNLQGISDRMKPVAKMAAIAGGINSGYFQGGDSPAAAYSLRAREVIAAAQPGVAERRARELVGPTGSDAPRFAAAFAKQMRTAAEFLQSKMPVPPTREGELQGDRKLPLIDKQSLEKFGRYWTGVNKPLECAQLLAKGQLRSEHVEALAAVHPQVLEAIQNAVLREVDTMPDVIPVQRVRQLDILLRLGGRADPTVKPENLRIMEQAGANAQAQKQAQGQTRQSADFAKAARPRSEELARM